MKPSTGMHERMPLDLGVSLDYEQGAVAKGSIAREAEPLMQVYYLEGDENEQLGELDLNQLNSFR